MSWWLRCRRTFAYPGIASARLAIDDPAGCLLGALHGRRRSSHPQLRRAHADVTPADRWSRSGQFDARAAAARLPTSQTSAKGADSHTANCALENFRRLACTIRCTLSTTSCRPFTGTTGKIGSASTQHKRNVKDCYLSRPMAIRRCRYRKRLLQPLRPVRAGPGTGPMATSVLRSFLAPLPTRSAVGEAALTVSLGSVDPDSIQPRSPDLEA